MLIKEIFEPYKKQLGIAAAVILIVSLGGAAYSGAINWSPSQPPASMKISLIPSVPAPPPPPVEESEPEPEPDTVAEEKRKADIIRAKEEKERKEKEEKDRKERDRKKKEEEKKKEDERKRKEDEKKRKEDERKRKEAAEEARRKAEAAAEAAKQRALFQRRVDRVAADIAARIGSRIRSYLQLPNGVPRDSDIEVILRVQLKPDGSLVDLPDIEKPSGFPEFDQAAIRAVLKSAPLPMPKEPFILNDKDMLEQFLEHRLYIRADE